MNDLCGIRHCRDGYDVIVWGIPICEKHWKRCCAEASGGSLEWLREHAHRELLSKLPVPAEDATPVVAPPRRVVRRVR